MKRLITTGLLIFAVTAFARTSGTSITVSPDEMKSGDTKTFTDDGRTITLTRDGDDIRVKIEGAGETKTLTITHADGSVIIDRDGLKRKLTVVTPGNWQGLQMLPHIGKPQSWYVCPKDHTTLHVPDAKDTDSFKCPVDGTTMEKRKGRGFSLYFDDDLLQSDEL
jgi:hypothetical protein